MDRKALYIGTGLDLNIINKLFFIKDFVFIDSQPYSEFGKETTLYDYDYYYWQNNFLSDFLPCFFRKINGYHRPNFLSDLKDALILFDPKDFILWISYSLKLCLGTFL